LLYLAANPAWKAKVKAEVESLIAAHTDTTSSEPLHIRLSGIPISAWEDSMPVLDACQKETLRIVQTSAALRRNIFEDLKIGEHVIPKGSFLVYSIADVHLNPDIYEDPFKFDPDRYAEGRGEDKKGTLSYLGWGAGRHLCSGMKVAKLEIKIVIALFLAGYEFNIVDAAGNPAKEFPRVDRNDFQQVLIIRVLYKCSFLTDNLATGKTFGRPVFHPIQEGCWLTLTTRACGHTIDKLERDWTGSNLALAYLGCCR